jgi:hypothetical protein
MKYAVVRVLTLCGLVEICLRSFEKSVVSTSLHI